MTDPIFTITTAEIIKLAFGQFVKTSAGETAKKLTGDAFVKAGELRRRIVSWFQERNDRKAEKAITKLEDQGSLEALNKLTTYVDDEMEESPYFSQELRQLAQEIINVQNMNQQKAQFGDMEQSNYGNAKGYQIQAQEINRIGDDYIQK